MYLHFFMCELALTGLFCLVLCLTCSRCSIKAIFPGIVNTEWKHLGVWHKVVQRSDAWTNVLRFHFLFSLCTSLAVWCLSLNIPLNFNILIYQQQYSLFCSAFFCCCDKKDVTIIMRGGNVHLGAHCFRGLGSQMAHFSALGLRGGRTAWQKSMAEESS